MRTPTPTSTSTLGSWPGIPVDAGGGPTIDPTLNVRELVQSSNLRHDDLREETNRRLDAELKAVRDIATLRAIHIEEVQRIRAEFNEKLRDAEAKRIDAIRLVDVNAVAIASERQAAAAGVLATQVAQSSDALRTLVATTANTVAEQQRQSTQQITERLAALEKSSYEGAGRSAYADPAVAALANEVKQMSALMSAGQGKQTVTDPAIERLTVAVAELTRHQATTGGQSAGSSAMLNTIMVGGGVLLGAVIPLLLYFVAR